MKSIKEGILERNRITESFPDDLRYTGLLATDITDHACQLKIVFKDTIHDINQLLDCSRRFENMFKWN